MGVKESREEGKVESLGAIQADKQLESAFGTFVLNSMMWEYVSSKHSNICERSRTDVDPEKTGLKFELNMMENPDIEWREEWKNQRRKVMSREELENDYNKIGYTVVYPPQKEIDTRQGFLLVRTSFIDNFLRCQSSGKQFFWYRFFVFHAVVQTYNTGLWKGTETQGFLEGHIMPLIFNRTTGEFEWYDSEGAPAGKESNVNRYTRVESALKFLFGKLATEVYDKTGKQIINLKKPLVAVAESCPRMGPQAYEQIYQSEFENKVREIAKKQRKLYKLHRLPHQDKILRDRDTILGKFLQTELGAIPGWCSVWTMVILDQRLSKPDLLPREVMLEILKVPDPEYRTALMRAKLRQFLRGAAAYYDSMKVSPEDIEEFIEKEEMRKEQRLKREAA